MAGPETNPAAPSDDSAKWASLAKELETPHPILDAPPDKEDGKPTPPPRTPEPPVHRHKDIQSGSVPDTPKPDEDEPEPDAGEPKPKPTYEQLETTHRNVSEALRYERDRAKKAEESLQAVHRMVEELRASRQQPQTQQQPPKPPPQIPDVDVDPIGHFKARQEIVERLVEESLRGSQQLSDQQAAAHQERSFWQHVDAAEQEYKKTKPTIEINGRTVSDYDLACDHLRSHRMKELESMYPDNSPVALQEARQMGLPTPQHLRAYLMQQDAAGIANRAFQLGVSPGELYYQAAVGRGYVTPKKPSGGNGSEKIAAAKRGVRASVTISGGDSQRASGDMSLSDLSDLWLENPEEFDKQWEVMKKAGKL